MKLNCKLKLKINFKKINLISLGGGRRKFQVWAVHQIQQDYHGKATRGTHDFASLSRDVHAIGASK